MYLNMEFVQVWVHKILCLPFIVSPSALGCEEPIAKLTSVLYVIHITISVPYIPLLNFKISRSHPRVRSENWARSPDSDPADDEHPSSDSCRLKL